MRNLRRNASCSTENAADYSSNYQRLNKSLSDRIVFLAKEEAGHCFLVGLEYHGDMEMAVIGMLWKGESEDRHESNANAKVSK